MEELFCVVQYKNSASTYAKMKNISWINKQKIYEAKILREEIGGENYHEEQCLLLPSEIIDSKHGIHLNPCYKKFTKILSNKQFKRKQISDESDLEPPTRPKRLCLDANEKKYVYPKECNLCKKHHLRRKGRLYFPVTITTENAVQAIKSSAKAKN